jgi:hypothetical protein
LLRIIYAKSTEKEIMKPPKKPSSKNEFLEGARLTTWGVVQFPLAGALAYAGYKIGAGEALISSGDFLYPSEPLNRRASTLVAMSTTMFSLSCLVLGADNIIKGVRRLKEGLQDENLRIKTNTQPNGNLRRPPERPDYDVFTGLPNDWATPERRVEIMAQLAVSQEDRPGEANNAPWTHAKHECFALAERLAGNTADQIVTKSVVNPAVSPQVSAGLAERVMDGHYTKGLEEQGLGDEGHHFNLGEFGDPA